MMFIRASNVGQRNYLPRENKLRSHHRLTEINSCKYKNRNLRIQSKRYVIICVDYSLFVKLP